MPRQAEIFYDGRLIGWIEHLTADVHRQMDPQYAIMGTPEITLRAEQVHILHVFHRRHLQNQVALEVVTPNGEIFNACVFTSYSMHRDENERPVIENVTGPVGEQYIVYNNARLVCAEISPSIPGTQDPQGFGEIRGYGNGRAPILAVTQMTNEVDGIGTEARRSITEQRWRRSELTQVSTPSWWLLFRDFSEFQSFLNNEHVNHGSCTNCLWHKYRIQQFGDGEHAQHCGDDGTFDIAVEFEQFREAIRNGSLAIQYGRPDPNEEVRVGIDRIEQNDRDSYDALVRYVNNNINNTLIVEDVSESVKEDFDLLRKMVGLGLTTKDKALKYLGLYRNKLASSKYESKKSGRKAMCLSQIGWAILKEEKKHA